MRIVVALGGNALRKKGESFAFENHYENAVFTFKNLRDAGLFEHTLCITHGNGPQVGMEFMRHFLTKEEFPMYPTNALIASTQGWIGYLLMIALREVLEEAGLKRQVCALVTTVEVLDEELKPSKPIGDFLTEEEAKELSILTGMPVRHEVGRGWRLVVPSPRPVRIKEVEAVRVLLKAGFVVICAGGGGIPVGKTGVVDKDLASALLAKCVDADALYILTSVPQVYLNFSKPNQEPIKRVDVKTLQVLIGEGHFEPGSMLPKILAAMDFVSNTGKKALITSPEYLREALRGDAGTWIVP